MVISSDMHCIDFQTEVYFSQDCKLRILELTIIILWNMCELQIMQKRTLISGVSEIVLFICYCSREQSQLVEHFALLIM